MEQAKRDSVGGLFYSARSATALLYSAMQEAAYEPRLHDDAEIKNESHSSGCDRSGFLFVKPGTDCRQLLDRARAFRDESRQTVCRRWEYRNAAERR